MTEGLKHVAIIMDGNGRWATARCHPRVWGHVRGASIVPPIVEEADRLGIKALTLYAFSTENWSRPLGEVRTLFVLLRKFLLKERQRILSNRIRFRVMGDTSKLPAETRALIQELESITQDAQGLRLTFAFGYGGRNEIVEAANRHIQRHPGVPLDERTLGENLFSPELGDVDLLIRTGGDFRISNFLLWQAAYAELYFTPTPWPEFTPEELAHIVAKVSSRERRFGGIGPTPQLDKSVSLAKRNLATLQPS